ncbi:hypothetical protein TKK_0005795, partial [Trichogramma kaykai]
MPNDNTTVCGCGVVLDLPKARYGKATTPTRNCNIYIPRNGKENGGGGGHHHRSGKTTKKTSESMEHLSMRGRGPNSRASEMGSTSSVAEHQSSRYSSKNGSGCSNGNAINKKDKRFSSGRRTRSAERISESHYTYIDSGSSIASIRDSAIAEHLYCTIDGEDDDDDGNNVIVETRASQQPPQQSTTSATAASAPTTTTTTTASNNAINQQHLTQAAQQQQQQQNNRPMHAIPSMTSPPPTYDVVIAKTWQTGLPPSYEEYLFHKQSLLQRSHTPPPPWTDSSNSSTMLQTTTAANNAANSLEIHSVGRELLASHPELREYLTQLALQAGAEHAAQQYHQLLSQHQALKKQAARQQRTRAMPP